MSSVVKQVGVSKKQVTPLCDDIFVQVPPGMTEKAISRVIEEAFGVEVTAVDTPDLDGAMVVTHEIAKGGRVKPLVHNFQFTWSYDDEE